MPRRPQRGGRRPRLPYRDRSRYHAELVDLGRLSYAVPLPGVCDGNTIHRLRAELAEAKAALGVGTSVSACLAAGAVFSALSRLPAGYRGLVGPLEAQAATVGRLMGAPMSPATYRNALRIWEAAGPGYIERTVAGRGRAEPLLDAQGAQVVGLDGRPAFARKGVLCVTFAPELLELWARPDKRASSTHPPHPTTPISFSGKPSAENPYGVSGNARTSVREAGRPRAGSPGNAVSGPAGPDGSTRPRAGPSARPATIAQRASQPGPAGPGAAASERRRPRARRFGWWPSRGDPHDRRHGRGALLYSVEGEARKRGFAGRELDELLDIAAEQTAAAWSGPTCLDWEGLIWTWRKLDRALRRRIFASAIMPALIAAAQHRRIAALPVDRAWLARGSPRLPGPRFRPRPSRASPAAAAIAVGEPAGPIASAMARLAANDPRWAELLGRYDGDGFPTEGDNGDG